MKTLRIVAVLVFVILAGSLTIEAQGNNNNQGVNQGNQGINQEMGQGNQMANQSLIKNLSDEQKLLLRQQQMLIKENREAFKATCTEEQLAIMENQQLTREERVQASNSLSKILEN